MSFTLLHKIAGREEGHEIVGWSYNGSQIQFGYNTYAQDSSSYFTQGIIDQGLVYIMNAKGSTVATYTFHV